MLVMTEGRRSERGAGGPENERQCVQYARCAPTTSATKMKKYVVARVLYIHGFPHVAANFRRRIIAFVCRTVARGQKRRGNARADVASSPCIARPLLTKRAKGGTGRARPIAKGGARTSLLGGGQNPVPIRKVLE